MTSLVRCRVGPGLIFALVDTSSLCQWGGSVISETLVSGILQAQYRTQAKGAYIIAAFLLVRLGPIEEEISQHLNPLSISRMYNES